MLIVTLPKNTPVQEAASLQDDLRRVGIEPWGWIINNSFAATQTGSPLLRKRAEGEITHIEAVLSQHAKSAVRACPDEESGTGRRGKLLDLSK